MPLVNRIRREGGNGHYGFDKILNLIVEYKLMALSWHTFDDRSFVSFRIVVGNRDVGIDSASVSRCRWGFPGLKEIQAKEMWIWKQVTAF